MNQMAAMMLEPKKILQKALANSSEVSSDSDTSDNEAK